MPTKPRRLREGDTVAAVTLSWGGPGQFPHRYHVGKQRLEQRFGLRVVQMPHTLADAESVAADPRARAEDLLEAFNDPNIAGIVSTIGGDDSIRILPYLDLKVIRSNPKVFLGYSDTTITQMACLRAGLVTFYGPSIMAGFAENAGLHAYLEQGVRRMLFTPTPAGVWPENRHGWTAEQTDWSDPVSRQRRRGLRPATGWRWVQGHQVVEGPLVVGAIEVLDSLRGTSWWPKLAGAVLALETSEEAPPPTYVTRFLRALAAMDDLGGLAGILLGRPGGAQLGPKDHAAYDDAVLRVVRDEQDLAQLPVITRMDFGHTDPIWTLPQGIRVRIDPATQQVVFTEAAVI